VLDEKSLRRPDWQDGQSCILADGQAWVLARPIIRWANADNDLGVRVRVRVRATGACGDYQAAYERLEATARDDKVLLRDLVGAELACAKILLLANYDLTPEQVGDLLQFGFDEANDPEGAAVRASVMDVVYGVAPKPSAAGDASP
jgi:hypothetical protein